MIVDDEPEFVSSLEMSLSSLNFIDILSLVNPLEVIPLFKKQHIDIVLLDLKMPKLSGEDLLKIITKEYPGVLVIIITASNDLDTAIHCIKDGAYDFISKPVEKNRLITTIKKAIDYSLLRKEMNSLKKAYFSKQLSHPEIFHKIITQSAKMMDIFQYIEAISKLTQPILVSGETGVGKELICETIQKLSLFNTKYTVVNVAGIDDAIFSDMLFGHEKGAFTGAYADKDGLLKTGDKGVILLDEIGDLSENSQIKLLRLIENGTYYPVGSNSLKKANVKFIFATNVDLEARMNEGKFRKDLYYRLSGHQIIVPPLRERMEDLELLAQHFIQRAKSELNIESCKISMGSIDQLKMYQFPGNIRELESIIYDCAATSDAEGISELQISTYLQGRHTSSPPTEAQPSIAKTIDKPTLKEHINTYVTEVLHSTLGNQRKAAKILGISPQAMSNRVKKLLG